MSCICSSVLLFVLRAFQLVCLLIYDLENVSHFYYIYFLFVSLSLSLSSSLFPSISPLSCPHICVCPCLPHCGGSHFWNTVHKLTSANIRGRVMRQMLALAEQRHVRESAPRAAQRKCGERGGTIRPGTQEGREDWGTIGWAASVYNTELSSWERFT